MARPHARRDRPHWPRRRTSPRSSSATSRWPPRRCATATEPLGRGYTGGRRATTAAEGGIDDGGGDRRDGESGGRAGGRRADEAGQDRPRRGGQRRPPRPRPDDAEVEAYLETALNAPAPERSPDDRPDRRADDGARRPSSSSTSAASSPSSSRGASASSTSTRSCCPTTRRSRSSSGAAPARSSCRAARCPSTTTDAPRPDPAIWSGRIPVLGICYGAQLMAHELGGDVLPADQREYGPANVTITADDGAVHRHRPRAAGLDEPRRLDHAAAGGLPRDRPDRLDAVSPAWPPPSATCTASSSTPRSSTRRAAATSCATSSVGHRRASRRPGRRPTSSTRPSPRSASGSTPRRARPARTAWSSARCRAASTRRSRPRSSIARSGDRLTCIYVDHGLMRKKESELLRVTFERDLGMNLVMVDARERFLARLAGVEDPEQKRRIIGDEFIRVFEEEAAKLGADRLPDPGHALPGRHRDARPSETKAAQKIKTHHNVGGLPADLRFQLIEPLRYLFKDEVRKVGLELGLPEAMVLRQPFPGPGLAIRIIGEVTAERLDTLREADWIVIDEIKARRPVPQPVAVVRDPHPGPQRRRDGRRPDLRQRRRHPGRDQRGRHDRRLGEAAVRRPGQDHRRGSSTRSRASTGSSTTSAPSRPPRSSGSERRSTSPTRRDGCPEAPPRDRWAIPAVAERGSIRAMADQPTSDARRRAVCPWCSAALPEPGRGTLPVVRRGAHRRASTSRCPGLTAVDAGGDRPGASRRSIRPKSRLLSWLSGDDARRDLHQGRRQRRSRRPTSRSGARCSGSSSRPRSPTSRPRPRRIMAEAVGRGPGRRGPARARRGRRAAGIELPTTAEARRARPSRRRRSTRRRRPTTADADEASAPDAAEADAPSRRGRRTRPRPTSERPPQAADAAADRLTRRRLSCAGARPTPAARSVVPARARGPHRRPDAPRRDGAAVRRHPTAGGWPSCGSPTTTASSASATSRRPPDRRPIRRSPASARRSPARCPG